MHDLQKWNQGSECRLYWNCVKVRFFNVAPVKYWSKMWNNVFANKIRIFIFLKTNCWSYRNVWEPSPHRCRNIITGTIWKIRKETFLKVQLISASETASGKTKGSNSLECVESDAAELAVDGDSAYCFRRDVNEILQVFL